MTTRAITMKDQTNDYLIMKLRTLAKLRDATPVEIQNNVNRLWDELETLHGKALDYDPTPDCHACYQDNCDCNFD